MKIDLKAAAGFVLFLALFTAPVCAVPVGLGSYVNPQVEGFEGVIGVSVPGGLLGGMWGTPPANFTFASGLIFRQPSPNNLSAGSSFIVGDYNTCCGSYGLGVNGNINSASYVFGEALGGTAGSSQLKSLLFELPGATNKVGLYSSTYNDVPLTMEILDAGGFIIETHVFDTHPVPFAMSSFVGLGSSTPIKFFRVTAENFVFDDVTWDAALPVPEPATASLALLGLGGLMMRRRRMA